MLKIYDRIFLLFLDPSPFPATILFRHNSKTKSVSLVNDASAIFWPEMVWGLVNSNILFFRTHPHMTAITPKMPHRMRFLNFGDDPRHARMIPICNCEKAILVMVFINPPW